MDRDQQPGMGGSNIEIVGLDGQQRHESIEERASPPTFAHAPQLVADHELSDRHCGEGHVVLVADQFVQGEGYPFCPNHDRRV